MAFQFKKISNAGASHPIVARLGLQTMDMIRAASLDEDKKEKITSLYVIKLTQRLLKCEEAFKVIQTKIHDDTERVRENISRDSKSFEVPFIVGLDGHIEDFLYAAKNFLRDLLGLFQIAYGCELKDAKVFGDLPEKGTIEIAKWAAKNFGTGDRLVALLKSEQDWTTELIRKRNAVEHPGDKSGSLTVNNIGLHHSNTALVPPSWYRTGLPETDVVTDMTIYVQNLLTLAEDVLADLVIRSSQSTYLVVYQIPERDRDPQGPVRLKLGLNPDLFASLQETAAKTAPRVSEAASNPTEAD
jgi:hypothetical protein